MAAPSPEDRLPYAFDAPRAPRSAPASSKPLLVIEHIEKVYPVRLGLVRMHMFTRAPFRPGWWHLGDEVPDGLLYVPPLAA
jgi:hypothetical protein